MFSPLDTLCANDIDRRNGASPKKGSPRKSSRSNHQRASIEYRRLNDAVFHQISR
jgi:hypothetical protein